MFHKHRNINVSGTSAVVLDKQTQNNYNRVCLVNETNDVLFIKQIQRPGGRMDEAADF